MKNFLLLFFLVFSALNVSSQYQDSILCKPDKYYWKSYLTDTRDVILFPKYLTKKDWCFIGGTLVAATALYTQDSEIQKFYDRNNDNETMNNIIDYVVEPWGGALYPSIAIVGAYGIGSCIKDERLKRVALLDLKTLVLAAGFSRVPKYIFQRHRPDPTNGFDHTQWEGPFHGLSGNYSFPSGHSFIAFSLATVTATEYKEKRGLVIALYTLAALTSFGRTFQNEHWSTDALVGASMGYAFGKFISRQKNWTLVNRIQP